ncbi:MAG: 2,3-bisphosphoglycerate-independent phosphoglycerate mutase [Haliangiales bacterium]
MDWTLRANQRFQGAKGPVVLVILDGVGIGRGDEADAVKIASTPFLDRLWSQTEARTQLVAHGHAVGLPTDDDMGNSEVGHNALGCGRVYDQGALLVNRAIDSGAMYEGERWREIIKRCRQNHSALHFIGLLSDGNVHSHIKHLIALLRRAAQDGVERLFVHALLDGRDVPSTSALQYVDQIEAVLSELSQGGCTAKVASGGGRMRITMDRYEADWDMVKRGYDAHVHGRARGFRSLRAAIETLREEDPECGDQFLPEFVIQDADGEPVGRIQDGDAVVNVNFRGDRAIEISRAFDEDDFAPFDRGDRPDVFYAGMMEYDGDLHVPNRYLVAPPEIERTMGEYLSRNQISQLALSETQKYGHVTYFWNGNRSGKFDDGLERYIEIPSDQVPFEQRPWMKAAEITDTLIAELQTGKHRFARINYANGDMVGHTGSFDATVIAMEVMDMQLRRLARVIDKLDGVMIVTADHGNADEMYQHDKSGQVVRDGASGQPVVKTSHTLNPVPFMVYDPSRGDRYQVAQDLPGAGIANVAASCFELLGFTPPDDFKPSLLRFK